MTSSSEQQPIHLKNPLKPPLSTAPFSISTVLIPTGRVFLGGPIDRRSTRARYACGELIEEATDAFSVEEVA